MALSSDTYAQLVALLLALCWMCAAACAYLVTSFTSFPYLQAVPVLWCEPA